MKHLLSLLSIINICILSQSCITAKKCSERFPPKEIVRDSIVYRDSIIEKKVPVEIKGESIYIRDYVYCDSLNRAQLKKQEVKHNHLTATVEIKDGKINIDCKEDSLIKANADLKVKLQFKERFKSETNVVEKLVYKDHWYDIPARWLAVIFLLIVIYKVIKRLYSIPF